MDTYARTHVGRQRAHNEDAVLCEPLDAIGGSLLAVADGMGGHQAGEFASQMATNELKDAVLRALADGRTDLRTILVEAFETTNQEIRTLADDSEYADMGTTLVAAVVRDGKGVVGNVGDSRAYLVGDGIKRITEDHSLVQELVAEGTITEEEAKTHPQRNVVTQAMGTQDPVDPDFFDVSLDTVTLLLCSDGLTEEIDDDEIKDIVTDAAGLEAAGDQLIKRANEKRGGDNVSVVLGAIDKE